jgi:di/tricarboxylate transporter
MLALSLILAVAVLLFVTGWLPLELTSLLLLPALYFTGLLPIEALFAGLSNGATVTIGAMFILSAGLSRTGALDPLIGLFRRFGKGSVQRVLVLLALTMPLISGFMNNTPLVVMMVPVLLSLAREIDVAPSRLMIPLSYFTILGGTLTLIGTSTNIIVNELYRDAGGPGFGLFEFTPMGLVYSAGGIAFILLVGQRLLPDRSPLSAMVPRERSAEFVTEIVIDQSSPLVGRPAGEVFRRGSHVTLLQLVRGEEVTFGGDAEGLALQGEDLLIIKGTSKRIAELLARWGASFAAVLEDDHYVPIRSTSLMLGEAVILPDSPFVGRGVGELALNRRFGARVLAVQRRGRHHRFQVSRLELRPGDVLLLQGDNQSFARLRESEAVLLVEGLEQVVPRRTRRGLSIPIMLGVIVLAGLTEVPISIVAVTGALAMVLTRCLRIDEAIRAIDLSILFLLVGTIPLGLAMQRTGLAERIVDATLALTGTASPRLIISAFYLLTVVLTALLSNSATAVLLTPIALSLSAGLGIDPKPLLVAVAFGASADFATPIGYQTNTIVFGPGGYQFRDYLKIGLPLEVIMWALASILIPVFWPLRPG